MKLSNQRKKKACRIFQQFVECQNKQRANFGTGNSDEALALSKKLDEIMQEWDFATKGLDEKQLRSCMH